MKVSIKPGQSLFDIAIEYTGKVENAIQIANDNGLDLVDELLPGMELEVSVDASNVVVRTLWEEGIEPGTAALDHEGGIGKMGVDIDFIIS